MPITIVPVGWCAEALLALLAGPLAPNFARHCVFEGYLYLCAELGRRLYDNPRLTVPPIGPPICPLGSALVRTPLESLGAPVTAWKSLVADYCRARS